MKFIYTLLAALFCAQIGSAQIINSQSNPNFKPEVLQELSEVFAKQYEEEKAEADAFYKSHNYPTMWEHGEGGTAVVIGLTNNGHPIVYATDNVNAAKTSKTDSVQLNGGAGLALDGNGLEIGEWDGGAVRTTHQQLTGRITLGDNVSTSSHATHVCGTMIANGTGQASAKGMATAADVESYDFQSDASEMASWASGTDKLLSNHSYGTITGWYFDGSDWYWYGDTVISATADYNFGYYSTRARSWDLMARNAPYWLIVKSAGNDRNDSHNGTHKVWSNSQGWVNSTTSRPPDGGTSGYDCISTNGNAKNILTVGAVADITNGYSQPSDVVMSSFSGWGPSDDGRIKPDIVANGISLFSTDHGSNTDYGNKSGTSMSAPAATGSMLLIQEHYHDSNNNYMLAATLKGLVIHTADEAGTAAGPDYQHGWGLLNTLEATKVISDTASNTIMENNLAAQQIDTFMISSDGTQPLRATICWTDFQGTVPSSPHNSTTPVLVNDLDLRVVRVSNQTISEPWILNPSNPSAAATTGDNFRDNVEQVLIQNPAAGQYVVVVSHKGTSLSGTTQDYSLIISGEANIPTAVPVADFSASPTTLCIGDTVQFTDLSTGNPTSYSWNFVGGTPSSSTSPNPTVVYNTPGVYAVVQTVSNSSGTDIETKTNYITVNGQSIVFTLIPDQCLSSSPFVLNAATPLGGTYSGPGVNGLGLFTPLSAGLGTHDIVYTVTVNGCTSVDSTTITVNGTNLQLTPYNTFCVSDTAFMLNNVTPTGGIYSGPGVTMNMFDPATAGVGTHTITYSYTASGCTETIQQTITVNNAPTATLGSFSTVCSSTAPFALTGGSPSGGSYFGPGVNSGIFDPSAAGVGTHQIGYLVVSGSCSDTAFSSIVVQNGPTVSISTTGSLCEDNNAVTLVPNPSGGTFSGPGVTGNIFDPSAVGAGAYNIVYTLNNGICTVAETLILVVNPLPTVTYTPPSSGLSFCSSDAPFTLSGGMPMGGTYSGPGVSAGVFDPSAAGVGSHTITYDYTDTNSCQNNTTFTINVSAAPTASLVPFATVCLNDAAFALTGGSPSGGTYLGNGVVSGSFDPLLAGVGTHVISYAVGSGGCSDTAQQSITVIDIPNVAHSPLGDVCLAAGVITLSGGTPTGGVYSGTGVSGNTFDPSIAGVGTHNITYTVTNASNCSDAVTVSVDVVNVATVVISDTTVCENTGVFALSSGQPSGGVYSGNGVNGNTFDPSIAGVGTTQIIYDYNLNGCSGSDTATFTINAAPVANLVNPGNVCLTGGTITLSATPSGGIFSGSGITNANTGTFDPTVVGVGTYTVNYIALSGGCSDTASVTFDVVNSANVEIIAPQLACNDSAAIPLIGSPAGGTFTGNGVVNNTFVGAQAGIGTHTVTYTVSGTCGGTATQDITVVTAPTVPAINGFTTVQGTGTYTYFVNPQNGVNYSWNVSNGSIVSTNGNLVSVAWNNQGPGELQVVATSSAGCTDSISTQVNIWPLSTNEILSDANVLMFPNPAKNVVFIQTEEHIEEVIVHDILGKEVLRQTNEEGHVNNVQLEVNELTTGVYMVRIRIAGKEETRQLIVD